MTNNFFEILTYAIENGLIEEIETFNNVFYTAECVKKNADSEAWEIFREICGKNYSPDYDVIKVKIGEYALNIYC